MKYNVQKFSKLCQTDTNSPPLHFPFVWIDELKTEEKDEFEFLNI